jgi:hypothetical protein
VKAQDARPDVVQIAQDAVDDCNNAGHCNASGHILVCCWPCLFALVESLVPEPQPARPCRLIRSGKWCIEHNAACPERQPAATVFLHRHDAAMYASPAPAARPQGGEPTVDPEVMSEPKPWICTPCNRVIYAHHYRTPQSASTEPAPICMVCSQPLTDNAVTVLNKATEQLEACLARISTLEQNTAKWERAWAVSTEDVFKAKARISKLEQALLAVVAWELPETGVFRCTSDKTHRASCDGSCGQYSFSFEYGSAGEKEYFRRVARAVLGAAGEGEE